MLIPPHLRSVIGSAAIAILVLLTASQGADAATPDSRCHEVWTDMRPLSVKILKSSIRAGELVIGGLALADEPGQGLAGCLIRKGERTLAIWIPEIGDPEGRWKLSVEAGARLSPALARSLQLVLGDGNTLAELKAGSTLARPEPRGGVVFEVETTLIDP